MTFRSSVTMSDFRRIREARATYVDKTAAIARLLSQPAQVVLFPRPRRFGKTLWLSTVQAFVEHRPEVSAEHAVAERAALFEGLAIWRDDDARAHAGRYPVIALTFKDVKVGTWQGCLQQIAHVLGEAFITHEATRAVLRGIDANSFDAVFRGTANPAQLARALTLLTKAVHQHYGQPAFVLIDEYDIPIQAAYTHGYYDQAIEFFRNLLSGGFKDNPHLGKGILTGILRVAKESIFSGLNNLQVHDLLSAEYADSFGFTEAEVADLARLAEAEEHLDSLRDWYNGYVFGGQVIYNPWSVLSFLGDPAKQPRPYWVATGSDDILRTLLAGGKLGSAADQEALMRGEAVEKRVIDAVTLRDLQRINADAAWSFLLFSGYLTASQVSYDQRGGKALMRIPNRELHSVYQRLIESWLDDGLGGHDEVRFLLKSLLTGQAEQLELSLQALLLRHVSYHDLPQPARELPYHMFVLGLLVGLAADYDVRSNRESGHGRADVLITPKRPGQAGVVLEFKRYDPDRDRDPDAALTGALAQIADRHYAAALRDAGATPVYAYAIVFDRKRVYVRMSASGPH